MRANLSLVYQEQAERFFDSQVDSYAIMQLDSSKVTPFEPFSSLRLLEKYGLKPNAEHYNIVYTDALPEYQNIHVFLESTYSRFNIDRPEDFKGHSLSVSDIVAIRQAGVVSCYYCDSIGFQKLDMVLEPQNYLKAAEMSMEDDYSMLDGVINNGKAPQLEDTPSMLGQLKEKAEACKDTLSPKKPKSKER